MRWYVVQIYCRNLVTKCDTARISHILGRNASYQGKQPAAGEERCRWQHTNAVFALSRECQPRRTDSFHLFTRWSDHQQMPSRYWCLSPTSTLRPWALFIKYSCYVFTARWKVKRTIKPFLKMLCLVKVIHGEPRSTQPVTVPAHTFEQSSLS